MFNDQFARCKCLRDGRNGLFWKLKPLSLRLLHHCFDEYRIERLGIAHFFLFLQHVGVDFFLQFAQFFPDGLPFGF